MRKFLLSLAENRTKFLVILLVFELIIISLITPYFLNARNMMEITRFGAVLTLLAFGESLVILSGKDSIDISIGASLSLSGVIFGLLVTSGVSLNLSMLITVIFGGLLGSINGLLIAFAKLPPLIATLGTQYVYGSLALYFTKGIPISGFPEKFKFLSLDSTVGIPNQILFVVIPISLIILTLLNKSVFGRKLYLMGTNNTAAKFSGISEGKMRFSVYTIAGILAAIGAIVTSSWLMTSRADAGTTLEMQAITVSVLGGISIAGGRGKISGVLLGVLIVTFLMSGLQIANINSMWQLALLGFILILSVVTNSQISNYLSKLKIK